jgi:hypothetical protein
MRNGQIAGEPHPTTMKNVYLVNVSGNARRAGAMDGLASMPITDVHFIDCNVTANAPLRMNHVERIDTSGLRVTNTAGEELAPATGPAHPPPAPATTERGAATEPGATP